MPDPSRLRALVSRLNGAPPRKDGPVRIRRRSSRVLLVLLSGASNLYGHTIMRAARVSSGALYPLLGQLAENGWVDKERQRDRHGSLRMSYRLTPKGRSEAAALLGLDLPGATPAMMPAPVADLEGPQ